VLLCDLNARALDETARDLGDRAIGRVTDVSDESQVEGALREACAAFGSLDIVVNCAGFGVIMPLTELPGDKWKSVQAVTLGGVFYGVKHGARLMLEQRRPGVIINISSVNAQQPGEGQVAYCAAKAGVDMITRCGALELGPRGIRVVGIAPGLVETPLTSKELENPAMRELFMGVIPMKRAVGATEIAAAAVYLASDDAKSINGHTIVIDAGSLTRGYPALLTGVKRQEPESVQAGAHS
jgi:NAD(P)-dependent dehydrogenase (short-subunit alcohol dehydrogenase family)